MVFRWGCPSAFTIYFYRRGHCANNNLHRDRFTANFSHACRVKHKSWELDIPGEFNFHTKKPSFSFFFKQYFAVPYLPFHSTELHVKCAISTFCVLLRSNLEADFSLYFRFFFELYAKMVLCFLPETRTISVHLLLLQKMWNRPSDVREISTSVIFCLDWAQVKILGLQGNPSWISDQRTAAHLHGDASLSSFWGCQFTFLFFGPSHCSAYSCHYSYTACIHYHVFVSTFRISLC